MEKPTTIVDWRESSGNLFADVEAVGRSNDNQQVKIKAYCAVVNEDDEVLVFQKSPKVLWQHDCRDFKDYATAPKVFVSDPRPREQPEWCISPNGRPEEGVALDDCTLPGGKHLANRRRFMKAADLNMDELCATVSKKWCDETGTVLKIEPTAAGTTILFHVAEVPKRIQSTSPSKRRVFPWLEFHYVIVLRRDKAVMEPLVSRMKRGFRYRNEVLAPAIAELEVGAGCTFESPEDLRIRLQAHVNEELEDLLETAAAGATDAVTDAAVAAVAAEGAISTSPVAEVSAVAVAHASASSAVAEAGPATHEGVPSLPAGGALAVADDEAAGLHLSEGARAMADMFPTCTDALCQAAWAPFIEGETEAPSVAKLKQFQQDALKHFFDHMAGDATMG